jgi:hypothetical protein
MRNTREQLDDALLKKAEKAIIDNTLHESDKNLQNYNESEDVPIDKHKNLKTIYKFLDKQDLSHEMQNNIAKLMLDFTKQ